MAGAGALLAVGLAFVSNADASHQYDQAVRCNGKTVRQVQLVTRSTEGAAFLKLRPGPGGRRLPVAYACLLRSGPITRLDSPNSFNRVRNQQLAGRYVAFKRTLYVSEFDSASGVEVVDLKTGQRKWSSTAMPAAEGDSEVLTLVVKRNGSVAWTAVGVRGEDLAVWKLDSTTPNGPQELDRGPQIDYETLSLTPDRRTVVWVNGGAQRTAPLS